MSSDCNDVQPLGGTTIHVYLSNKNKSKLEKQHARYVSKDDFDELKNNVISWSDIRKIVDYIDKTKTYTKSESALPYSEDSDAQESGFYGDTNIEVHKSVSNEKIKKSVTFSDGEITRCVSDVPITTAESPIEKSNEHIDETETIETHIDETETTETHIDENTVEIHNDVSKNINNHPIKKLPIPPTSILEKRKSIIESPEINIEIQKKDEITLDIPDIYVTKDIVAKAYANATENSKHIEFPDLNETKEIIAKAYTDPRTIIFPNIDKTREIIAKSYEESKPKSIEIPDIVATKNIIAYAYADDAICKCKKILLDKNMTEKELNDTIKEETVTHREPIKNIFDIQINETETPKQIETETPKKIETETPEQKSENDKKSEKSSNSTTSSDFKNLSENMDKIDVIKVDDLIIKTRGEYNTLMEYRKKMLEQSEQITHVTSLSLPKVETETDCTTQQILIPISTKPICATKKRQIKLKKH